MNSERVSTMNIENSDAMCDRLWEKEAIHTKIDFETKTLEVCVHSKLSQPTPHFFWKS